MFDLHCCRNGRFCEVRPIAVLDTCWGEQLRSCKTRKAAGYAACQSVGHGASRGIETNDAVENKIARVSWLIDLLYCTQTKAQAKVCGNSPLRADWTALGAFLNCCLQSKCLNTLLVVQLLHSHCSTLHTGLCTCRNGLNTSSCHRSKSLMLTSDLRTEYAAYSRNTRSARQKTWTLTLMLSTCIKRCMRLTTC